MGSWGTGLFDDDTACDVRDRYDALLAEKGDGGAATDALLEEWKDTVADVDESGVFWLSLAVTQHRRGRLEARVLREARRVLVGGLGLDRWRDDAKALKARLAALAKVRAHRPHRRQENGSRSGGSNSTKCSPTSSTCTERDRARVPAAEGRRAPGHPRSNATLERVAEQLDDGVGTDGRTRVPRRKGTSRAQRSPAASTGATF